MVKCLEMQIVWKINTIACKMVYKNTPKQYE